MKLFKHELTLEDVESVLALPVVFAGRIVDPAHDEPRSLLLGQSTKKRRLTMIFTRRGDRLRPFSRRSMLKLIVREHLDEYE